MCKFLVIGDPHFREDNIPEMKDFSKQVLEIVHKNNFDAVVILGDTLHTHKNMNMPAFNEAVDFIFDISDKVQTFVLIGNHDLISSKVFLSKYNPFVCFKRYQNIHVIYKPEIFEVKTFNFLFVPFIPTGRYFEALKSIDIDFTKIKAVFSHQEFRGCKMENMDISENGDPWPLDYPLNISGHIHMYQQPQVNLIYPGTPIQHTFKELPDKAISIFEFTTTGYTFERLPLNLPKKIEITVYINQLDDLKLNDYDKYKIRILGTASEIKTLIKTQKYKELQDKGVKLVPESINDPEIQKIQQSVKVKRENYYTVLKERLKGNAVLSELLNNLK